uniref:Pentacotripeptide-repeat region of PRORP domain-containing protein n=1 Tax=Globisporangium ultimum (strain ATCC 200006 / CBS 805.95 / DAOM BR144) TaxID=431595 RepID=K3WLE8_GLOUD
MLTRRGLAAWRQRSSQLLLRATAPAVEDVSSPRSVHVLIFEDRRDRGEELNFFAHNAALTALLESNQLEKVHQFAAAMKQEGFKWDTLTYQNVLLAYIRGGAIDTAVHMLHSNAKKMDKSTECYRELIQYYVEKGKNPREACRLTMQMMQNNARLSRLDWHNALTHALMLPDRALYWNFRKWMKIRAAGIVHEVPKHLMLPDNAQKQKKQHKEQQQQKLL